MKLEALAGDETGHQVVVVGAPAVIMETQCKFTRTTLNRSENSGQAAMQTWRRFLCLIVRGGPEQPLEMLVLYFIKATTAESPGLLASVLELQLPGTGS